MRKTISTGLIVLLVLLGLGVFLLSPTLLRESLRKSNLDSIQDYGKQQRKINKKVIQWRLLEIKPRLALNDVGTSGNIVGGDFNGDGNQEILFLPTEGVGVIYTPEGDIIPTALNGAMHQPAGAWDYDLDGKMEIYRIPTLVKGYTSAFDGGRTFETEIFSLDGVLKATLNGLAVKNPRLVFDYDGDSNADLALLTGKTEFSIYGSGGLVLTRLHTNGEEPSDHLLPIIKSMPDPIDQPCGGYNYDDINGAVSIADVDGQDGLELLMLNGILDLMTGEITRFKYPENLKPDRSSNLPPTAGDFFATGFNIVVVPTVLSDKRAVGVSVFDKAGSFIAVSEVGFSLLGLQTINSDGNDYLVAHAPDRIMIFP